jgi:hypothetical protein
VPAAAAAVQMLLGPFVDVEQPLITGGMINVTFQQLFQTQVRSGTQALSHTCVICSNIVAKERCS